MSEFFNGWRRKAGLLLLVMALCIFGMWMRSYLKRDVFCFYFSRTWWRQCFVLSESGQLHWYSEDFNRWIPRQQWMTDDPDWILSRFPTVATADQNVHPFEIAVSYWPMTTLLTLLSAALLLWPQRKAKGSG